MKKLENDFFWYANAKSIKGCSDNASSFIDLNILNLYKFLQNLSFKQKKLRFVRQKKKKNMAEKIFFFLKMLKNCFRRRRIQF